MAEHGARHIVLLSRSGGNAKKLRQLISETQDKANIIIKVCDIANEEDAYRLVREHSETLPPICGVVHAAMMLHVSLLSLESRFYWSLLIKGCLTFDRMG